MTDDHRAPEQDASKGPRKTVEDRLSRDEQKSAPDGKTAIPTPVEPGDQNAQTTPP
jgi:hypothetical protein